MQRYILGSASPRRKEILDHFSLPFEQAASDFDEASIPFKGDAAKYVLELSAAKAAVLRPRYPEAVILTADTIVWKEGVIFGKPKDKQEAFYILKQLSGKWHSVFTGLSLSYQNKFLERFEETRVLFNPLSDLQIQQYHNKMQWADKAGAYAIQGTGGLVVRRIEGCYYNVLGLPINALCTLLSNIEIDLWAYIK